MRHNQASLSLLGILFVFTGVLLQPLMAAPQKQKPRSQTAQQKKRPAPSKSQASRLPIPINLPQSPSLGEENEVEQVEKRQEWFLFQRTYPFASIPANARRQAWESRPGEQFQPNQVSYDWRPIGPAPTDSSFPKNWGQTSGRINTIAIAPNNPQIVLIGAATGGIWRSTDGGQTFVPTTDEQVDLAVSTIAFSPSNPSVVYAGMGDVKGGYLGTGVLKSTDTGQTWQRINNESLPSPGYSRRIKVDPFNPNRVYLALSSSLGESGETVVGGIYVSSDGGVNWKMTLRGLSRDLEVAGGPLGVVYATMKPFGLEDAPIGLFRSSDYGETWNVIFDKLPYIPSSIFGLHIGVSLTNPQVIYLFSGGYLPQTFKFEIRIDVSTNGGNQWAQRNTATIDPTQFGYNSYIVVDPGNADTLYAGTRDIYKSTNGGRSWLNLTRNFNLDFGGFINYTPEKSLLHTDQHAFEFIPGNPNAFFAGCDGGLYKSSDGGTTFQSLNTTLGLTQFYGITVHPTDPFLTYGGAQDNGLQRRSGASLVWTEFSSGDGGQIVINPLNPEQIFTAYTEGNIDRWGKNGNRFEKVVATNGTFQVQEARRVAFIAPFTGNEVDSTLYFGTWRLFISKDLGESWSPPAGELDLTKDEFDVLSTIGVSRSNPKVIYTGSGRGRVMVSTDGGKTYTDITAGLPNRYISSIKVDPTNPAIAYLTVSGYRSGHVFKTANFGDSWTDISGNLPDIPVNTFLIDPSNATRVYVGTDIGVFRSTTGGGQWESFQQGMPPAVVTGLAAQKSGVIRAATYGRGMYELAQDNIPPTITVLAPNGPSDKLRAGTTFLVRWQSSDNVGVVTHDVLFSTDSGATYPTTLATGLTGTAQFFDFAIPTSQPKTKTARIRVIARDAAGNTGQDDSNASLKIKPAR